MTTPPKKTTFGTLFGNAQVEPLTDFVFFQEGPGLRKWQWTDSGIKVVNGRNILVDGTIDLSNTDRFISGFASISSISRISSIRYWGNPARTLRAGRNRLQASKQGLESRNARDGFRESLPREPLGANGCVRGWSHSGYASARA